MSLLKTLEIIDIMIMSNPSLERICEELKISERTANRYIKEARHLGADIESYFSNRAGKCYRFRLNNRPEILNGPFKQWLELEKLRELNTKPLINDRHELEI